MRFFPQSGADWNFLPHHRLSTGLGGINPVMKRHLELEIKTLLQKAPRDEEKLERLLKAKKRQKEEAIYFEDTQRLVTEIEMLKVVMHLIVSRGGET